MKKLLLITLTIILAFTLSLSAFAEEVPISPSDTVENAEETPSEVAPDAETPEEQTPDTEATAPPEADVQVEANNTDVVEVVDIQKTAEQFIQYIFSGDEGADELMAKIAAIGEQYQQSKENGYTFQERLVQMFTTENLVVLSSAAFLVICGVAFFFIEAKRKKDRLITSAYIARLEKKYNEEVKSNKQMREAILEQSTEIDAMKVQLCALCEASEANKLDLDKSTNANLAVAKMVKDVFLNSKTIDANAKSLLIHNYLEAVGDEGVKETSENE